ncbi:MAG: sugar phosphate isomerase/epimerase [Planctomycetales bacterium]|nr:sugar phosphate isomerase/epimerase [Planctomycetales bacterium]
MNLSLSVRIAEGFLSKEHPILPLAELADVALSAGYSALCMRASQIGVNSSAEHVMHAAKMLSANDLSVSMITGDFDIVYNNERGPNALANISPYLELATALGSTLIRVALKKQEDIPLAQRAADAAREVGIRLVHQCHTLSLFETVESIETTLKAIGRENFGIIYEPANLELCGQSYGRDTLERLAPWIFNVYLQNQRLKPDGAVTLDTWCRGPVAFDIIQIHEPEGIRFAEVIGGLRHIGYDGWLTVHQSAPEGTTPAASAQQTADYLRELLVLPS